MAWSSSTTISVYQVACGALGRSDSLPLAHNIILPTWTWRLDHLLPRAHQDLDSHGHIDNHAYHEPQGTRRLWQWHLVGYGVKQTREEEEPEVVKRNLCARVDSNIEETQQYERYNVLYIVQMVSGKKEKMVYVTRYWQ